MNRGDSFQSNVFFAITSNLTIAVVSILSTFVLPKILGVEEYGYWQLFIFYGSYVLLLQVGVADGANLRYAGLQERELKHKGLRVQAISIFTATALLSLLIFFLAPILTNDESRQYVLQLSAVFASIINLRHFILTLFQATGNFRIYSKITILDRLIFVALVVIFLITKGNFIQFIIAEIISKLATLFIAIYFSRHFLIPKFVGIQLSLKELSKNIYSGIKLTLANTSNMLILGVARFLIDRTFGVLVFGSISLVLSVSAFFMVFVKAVGLVLLPTLRRSKIQEIAKLYELARLPISLIPLSLLIFVYPMMELLIYWLPDYRIGIQYLPILIPLISFESKISLLVDPFLKALRKENFLLLVNITALIVSIALGVISTILLKNLNLSIFSIFIALCIRTILAEFFLLKQLQLRVKLSTIFEFVLIFASLFLNIYLGGLYGMFTMGVLVTIFSISLRKEISNNSKKLFHQIRSS